MSNLCLCFSHCDFPVGVNLPLPHWALWGQLPNELRLGSHQKQTNSETTPPCCTLLTIEKFKIILNVDLYWNKTALLIASGREWSKRTKCLWFWKHDWIYYHYYCRSYRTIGCYISNNLLVEVSVWGTNRFDLD